MYINQIMRIFLDLKIKNGLNKWNALLLLLLSQFLKHTAIAYIQREHKVFPVICGTSSVWRYARRGK